MELMMTRLPNTLKLHQLTESETIQRENELTHTHIHTYDTQDKK